jgi:hypothetical protein
VPSRGAAVPACRRRADAPGWELRQDQVEGPPSKEGGYDGRSVTGFAPPPGNFDFFPPAASPSSSADKFAYA